MQNDRSLTSAIVWDPFVRVFHWTLVSCVLLNYFVIDGGAVHDWIGYLAFGLVLARIVWGFVGSHHARFSDFFPTPHRLRHHLQELRGGRVDPRHDGHNPLGALMMLGLLAMVLALGVTGWMQGLDRFWGEEWLQDFHSILASILIAMAALHALAAVVMSRLQRVRLVRAMFTGVKERW